MYEISMLQDLASKLNHWLYNLQTQNILVESKQPAETKRYRFEITPGLSDSESSFMLRKMTHHGLLLQRLFSEMQGIEPTYKNDKILLLKQSEHEGFKRFNDDFESIAEALQEKLVGYLQKGAEHPNAPTHYHFPFDLDQLKREISGTKKITTLSFPHCGIGLLSENLFAEVMTIIRLAHCENIDLNSNELHKLDAQKLALLFEALKNPFIKEINLDKNNLGDLLIQNVAILISFLQNKYLDKISLKENNLDDNIVNVLGEHGRIKAIALNSNNINDAGLHYFKTNYCLTTIHLFRANVNQQTLNALSYTTTNNKRAYKAFVENAFIEQAIVIAQGARNSEKSFNRLPHDITILILALLGNGLRDWKSVHNLCTLIVKNIANSSPKTLVWGKNLQVGDKIHILFKEQTYNDHFVIYRKTFFRPLTDARIDPKNTDNDSLKKTRASLS